MFVVIAGVLAFWWLRGPALTTARPVALLAPATPALSTATAAPEPAPTPLPSTTASPTLSPAPTATPAPTPVRYKVQSGDSLELIAGQHGSTVKDIIEANGLNAAGFIRVGDELLVPVAGAHGGSGPTATPAGGTLIYMVQPGDTLMSIVLRFNSDLDWILSTNKLKENAILSIGQALLVPLSGAAASPAATTTPGPLATFTPAVGYRAPLLLSPADGAAITGSAEVVLNWTSVGVLGRDEWYVVTLLVKGGDQPAPYWTTGSTWRLSPTYRRIGVEVSEFTWQVQVIAGTPGKPGQSLSPASPARTFSWR